MTIEEAFFKQKDELHALQRENRKLNKELEASRKGLAADKEFQDQLSHIQGLKNKISELTHICDRYKDLYEEEKLKVKSLKDKNYVLELEVLHLKDRLSLLDDDAPSSAITSLKEAEAQIAALKDEIARLNAQINSNSTNAGIPSSKTPIGQKKAIPNSREKSGLKKGGQSGHPKHEMAPFPDDEVTDTVDHPLTECPMFGSNNLEESVVTIKEELDYEV